jgi:hypothetical protein
LDALVCVSSAKGAEKKADDHEQHATDADGLHDVPSSDKDNAIFEIAKETPVDVLNFTLNNKGSLTSEERLVLWKMARDAVIRGDAMASLTLMSFLNEARVTHAIPITTPITLPRNDLGKGRAEIPLGVLNKTSGEKFSFF